MLSPLARGRFFRWVLLLLALLNALAGLPLHEIGHAAHQLAHQLAHPSVDGQPVVAQGGRLEGEADDAADAAPCLWCLASAGAFALASAMPVARAAVLAPRVAPAWSPSAYVPAPPSPPFASRGPPSTQL